MRLAGRPPDDGVARCAAALDPAAPDDYRELAAILAGDWSRLRPRRVGLSGGQGAGKSTLAGLLEAACEFVGLRACVLGLDDFYRTRAERRELAARIHPLFETRGPPGTHDVEWCREALIGLGEARRFEVPVFDKGRDDRVGTRSLEGPFDLVVLEGWCVGAAAVAPASLRAPINALERQEDPDGRFRDYVNAQLEGPYRALWTALDQQVFLEVPDLAAVRRWRGEQEAALPADRRFDVRALDRFIAHYERVTRSMLETGPERADVHVQLAADHSVAGLRFR